MKTIVINYKGRDANEKQLGELAKTLCAMLNVDRVTIDTLDDTTTATALLAKVGETKDIHKELSNPVRESIIRLNGITEDPNELLVLMIADNAKIHPRYSEFFEDKKIFLKLTEGEIINCLKNHLNSSDIRTVLSVKRKLDSYGYRG